MTYLSSDGLCIVRRFQKTRDRLGKYKIETRALRDLLIDSSSCVYETVKLARPCLLFKDKETRRWSELRTSSQKDLGTAATPITVSDNAPTAPSVYMCELLLGLH